MFRWGLVLLVVLAAAGCGARFRGAATGPDSRALARLQRQAQRDIQCPSPLHVVPLEPRAFQVEGCSQVREYAWSCAGRRCAFTPMVPAVTRASADLQCAPAQLVAQADSPVHRAFFGCMRGAAYRLLCVDHGCTWSRTAETVAIGGAAPPPPVASVMPAAPVSDPSLDGAVIPPPPGATTAIAPTAVAPASASVPPPPGAPSDAVVIPPPPPR